MNMIKSIKLQIQIQNIIEYILFQLMSKKQTSFLNSWQPVGNPDSGIVRQSTTGRQGQRRILALDPLFDTKNQQFIYNYRRETGLPFVGAYGSQVLKLEAPPKNADKKQKQQYKDPYNHMAVVTERIPHRLVDCPQLTYPESLYTLDRALEGYETGYDKCGPMRVNDRMIGFNNQGHCKVWVNEDFANNHPSYPRRRLMSTRVDSRDFLEGRFGGHTPASTDQVDMVQDVVDTVENYSQQGRFPQPFGSRIHARGLSFADARRILHENIVQNRIPVPDRVDLFTNRVRGYKKVTQHQQHVQHHQTTQQVVRPGSLQQVIQPVGGGITTTTSKTQGYRFNYIPPEKPYHPDIFASRVGDHGVHHGVRY